ncbi:sugar ABC transporter ATP-binding protein [Aliiruegeria lutimaris]|uniref:Monosaccharide ABC transporter ATP-binding protein, CUT2 family n=1 Tax=Aliiruegeria lutimaris TaxID=571298 RepID=A0A1G8MSK2_9RHOB|nr:sugar ABC transporter ATP-binding protein [Aliiruegeria lutimaris]SDI70833.1 monosaccharide ABC transporter ATP-binding protein, CUT2 family [Aliiruegeria lutimaris]
MAFLEVEDLGRDFPGVRALNDVSLKLELGRVHVLAGENGAGKSTLVKLVTGAYRPSRGRILIDGQDVDQHPELHRYVAYVPQELNLFPNLSVAENLFLPYDRAKLGGATVNRREIERAAQEYLDRYAITAAPRDLVRDISVPEQQLLQIARASTNHDMKVLFLDEPTSSLTSTEIERVMTVIRGFRDSDHAIVFISHKIEEVLEIGDEYTVLRNGEKVADGLIAKIDEPGLIRAMSGAEIAIDQRFRPDPPPEGAPEEVILDVQGLSGHGFENVSFRLKRGEILGFAGLLGAGRSEVMQSIFGYMKATAGTVALNGKDFPLGDTSRSVKAGLLYLSEERKLHGILPQLSVRENIGISILDQITGRLGISRRQERSRVHDIIKAYDIKVASMSQQISNLSGGNQQKTIIGRAMATEPVVLIFDEPTKGIDVRTKAEIYRIMKSLAERGVGILLVSSEMEELRKCANRIVAMYSGRITGSFDTATTSNETLVGAMFGSEKTNAA